MSNKIAALSQRPAAAQNAEAERCDEVLGKAFVQKGKAEKKGGGGGYNSACARFEWMTETGSTDTRRHFFVVVVVVGSHFNSKARVLRL